MTISITEAMDLILKKLRENVISFYVVAANLHEFEVHEGNAIRVLTLQDKTCSCNTFKLDGYPCIYALAI